MNVKHNDQMVPKLLSIFISKDLHFCGDYFTFISPNFIILAISNFLIKPCIIIKSFLWPIFLRIKKFSRHIIIIHLCNFNYIIFFMHLTDSAKWIHSSTRILIKKTRLMRLYCNSQWSVETKDLIKSELILQQFHNWLFLICLLSI